MHTKKQITILKRENNTDSQIKSGAKTPPPSPENAKNIKNSKKNRFTPLTPADPRFPFRSTKRMENQSVEQADVMMDKLLASPKITSHPRSDDIFKLFNIDPQDDANYRIVDSKSGYGLYLLHSVKNTDNLIRGTVISVQEDIKVKCISFPFTEEISATDFESSPTIQLEFNEQIMTTVADEGTIIRVFWADSILPIAISDKNENNGTNTDTPPSSGSDSLPKGRWYRSTSRKIDGTSSRWSGPAFGKLFDELWPSDIPYDRYLQRDSCYVFLLSHPENRIVCKIEKPLLKLVAIYQFPNNKTVFVSPESVFPAVDENRPFVLSRNLKIANRIDLIRVAKEQDWQVSSGILYHNPVTNECIKIMPNKYVEMRPIRGNVPSLRLRYLELKAENKSQLLRNLYPEKADFFDNIDDQSKVLLDYLVLLYKKRFLKNEYIRVPQQEYYIITKTHEKYREEYSIEKNVKYILSSSTPRQINAMIKHMSATFCENK